MDEDYIFVLFVAFWFGGVAVLVMMGIGGQFDNNLTQEAINDICKNLSDGDSTSGYISNEGKLVCEVPSYDHTTNIIIREAGDE